MSCRRPVSMKSRKVEWIIRQTRARARLTTASLFRAETHPCLRAIPKCSTLLTLSSSAVGGHGAEVQKALRWFAFLESVTRDLRSQLIGRLGAGRCRGNSAATGRIARAPNETSQATRGLLSRLRYFLPAVRVRN